jgi:DNA-binding SARP family transcriptional activator
MSVLRVYLLGGLVVTWDETQLPLIPGVLTRSLFGYLVTYRDRSHNRDLLAGTFWPDLPDAVARRRLSQSLWQIRKALSPHPVLITEADTVQLNPDLPLWVDVTAFEEACRQTGGRTQRLPPAQAAESGGPGELVVAVDLYRGAFLSGYYDNWVLPERERLHGFLIELLAQLVAVYKQHDEYEHALSYARRLATEDPWREEAHCEVMRLCHLLGRDHEALQQFRTCRRVLDEDLGAEPSPGTTALAAEIARRAGEQGYPLLPTASRPAVLPLLERPDRLPLAGRQREMAELLQQLESAARGAGGLTLVYGEAGVGKTRLLRELADNAQWRGMCTVWGRCYELAAPPAYQPLVEALRADIAALQNSALEPLWRVELSRLLPELDTGGAEAVSLEPEEERHRLSEAIARGFLMLAVARPCLVLLEDAHWMDPASLEAIRYLLPRLDDASLCLVISIRREELTGRQAEIFTSLENTRLPHRLDLGRLDPGATGELVEHALGLEQPAPLFSTRLHNETEGNPFFLIETLWSLVEDGLLYRDAQGTWSTPWDDSTDDYAELPLPAGVLQSIERRLERLPPRQRDLLSLAAIIGRGVAFGLWHQASSREESEVLDAADALCRKSLLARAEPDGGQADYVFSHHHIRRVAYERLAAPRRRIYHRRVAETLERLSPGEPEALAYHWMEARVWDKAIDYHRQAGDRALAVYANAEALHHYDEALEALDCLPGMVEPVLRYELHLTRELVYDLHGEREAQAQDLAVLARLAQQLGDSRRQGQVALRQAHYADRTGDYPAAITAAETAIRLARSAHDLPGEAEGLVRLGQALTRQGDYRAAQLQLEGALRRIRSAEVFRDPAGPHTKLQADCLRSLGTVLWCLAEYAAAERVYVECLALCRESGYRYGESLVLSKLGVIHAEQGDYGAAQAYHRSARQICREIGHRFGEVNTICNSSIVSLYLGDHDNAEHGLAQGLRICQEIGHRRAESVISTYLALLCDRKGDDESAREWGQRALLVAEQLGDRPVCSDALTNLGHALAGLGHLAGAAQAYGRALKLRRELGEHNRAMESLAGLAGVLLAQGNLNGARRHVDEILDHLESRSLDGADEPFRVYLTCYRVLRATGDPHAQEFVSHAYHLLQQRASKIAERDRQHSFLENIPAHRAIAAAVRGQRTHVVTVRLASADAPTGRPLHDEEYVAVAWTVVTPEDDAVPEGVARRQARLARLLQEAADQGAAPTVGDLAEALDVSSPTVRRDLAALRQAGHQPQTRGSRRG